MEEMIVTLGFFAMITALGYMKNQRKLAEMRLMRGIDIGVGSAPTNDVRQMQQQIAELRDTTTRYDMAMDGALQRIEMRIAHLESRLGENTAEVNASRQGF